MGFILTFILPIKKAKKDLTKKSKYDFAFHSNFEIQTLKFEYDHHEIQTLKIELWNLNMIIMKFEL